MTLVKGDGRCFVCGPENPSGLQVSFVVDPEARSATARTRLSADYQGWAGIVHGGVIASLLDEVCMYACRTLGDQMVTAELTVRYRSPLPVETEVELDARVVGTQKRLVLAEGRITAAGRVVAEADAKVFRLS